MSRTAFRATHFMRKSDVDDVVRYLQGQIQPDGGFRGRAPVSDLYYTVFGLSALIALNQPVPFAAVRTYLESFGDGADLDFVHQASAARCWAAMTDSSAEERSRDLLRRMETHRAADGGYNLLVEGAAQGSVYGGFLACLAYEEAGAALPRPESLLASIRALVTADGGYANTADMPVGITTATAAAVLLQKWIAGVTDAPAVDALRACACEEGGFRALVAAPGPDLLSTATVLYALRVVGQPPAQPDRHLAFIELLWDDNGGFRGHAADPVTDCEYTFYALLALGCLHDD